MPEENKPTIDQLPADVQQVLNAEIGYLQELQLAQKYNLADDLGTISDLVEKIYQQQIKLNDLADYVKINLPKLNSAETNKFLLDLIGWRVLPIKDYLSAQNVPGFMSLLGGRESDYAAEVAKTKQAMAEEAAGTFDATDYREDVDDRKFKPELEPPETENDILTDEELDDKDKRSNLLNVFNSNLSDILNIDATDEMYQFLNEVAVDCLVDDKTFGAKAAAGLAANSTTILNQNLVLNNKVVPGTAANWLKDFFRINGSGWFDALALSTYLSDSSNVKKLNQTDKNVLNRFFKLYRNLQFFPQGFDQSDPDKWQVLPEAELAETVNAPVAAQAEENLTNSPAVNELQQLAEQYEPGSLERLAIEEELRRQDSGDRQNEAADDLANLAEQYPVGSLEREAIEEEMRKRNS